MTKNNAIFILTFLFLQKNTHIHAYTDRVPLSQARARTRITQARHAQTPRNSRFLGNFKWQIKHLTLSPS